MNPAQTLLQAMNSSYSYSAEQLAGIAHQRVDDVKRYLRMLEKAELVESTPPGRYKRNKQWRSKQKSLFA